LLERCGPAHRLFFGPNGQNPLQPCEPASLFSIRGARGTQSDERRPLDCRAHRLVVDHRPVRSGKSSLAFDTGSTPRASAATRELSALRKTVPRADAEARRRFERGALSPDIRRREDDVANTRSTVGTVTRSSKNYLRLRFARVGVPYSPDNGLPIESQTVSHDWSIASSKMAEGTRLYMMAPSRAAASASPRKNSGVQKKGFQRVQGATAAPRDRRGAALDKKYKHDIDVVVDDTSCGPICGNRPGRFDRGPPSSSPKAWPLAENADYRRANGVSERFACPSFGLQLE